MGDMEKQGGIMGLQKSLVLSFLVLTYVDIVAAPLIQKINNRSSFGFVVLKHSDISSCSLNNKNILIEARTVFHQDFLLEIGHPSLELRPVYYFDTQTNQKIAMTDEVYNYIPEKIQQAYEAWKKNVGSRKKQTSKEWFDGWVGQDLRVTPHIVSIFGYLNNWSRVVVENKIKKHKNNMKKSDAWIKFAKGIFSKEVLELDIEEYRHNGVFGSVKIIHGEGGVCIDGRVERI